jgi:(p)ppGpp synthase/HD superfamily hydrolase
VRRRISVVLSKEQPTIGEVISALTALPATVSEVEYERRLDDDKKPVVAIFDVQFADRVGVPRLIEAIESVSGVRRVHVQQPH